MRLISHREIYIMKTILIVEDEGATARALAEKFKHQDFNVLSAKNGEEGLALALKNHPDAILLDVLMPKMDGLTMMNKLREDAWGKNVPIIVLTNLNPDDMVMREIVKNEPAYYLIKSELQIEDLVEKVKERLRIN